MPTALELTREEWQAYIDAARQRLPQQPKLTSDEQQTREQLLDQVRKAADILKQQFGVKQVVLFGSLADIAWFASDSDVDLAVEGLSNTTYWQAWKAVEDIIGGRSVDLVEIETAKESLVQAIYRYGIKL